MTSGNEPGVFGGISRERLAEILAAIGIVRAAVAGDLCLDVYWKADMTQSELSRETPHFSLPIVEERYSPGAGGNVAVNVAALQPASVSAVGVVGPDWRGDLLLKELAKRGIGVSGIVSHPRRTTNAYIKPYRRGISELEYEDPRLDFVDSAAQPLDLDDALIAQLDRIAPSIDVLCVSDQSRVGCITPAVRAKIITLAEGGLTVVVDSRSRIGQFRGCILKPNEVEGAAAVNGRAAGGEQTLEEYSAVVRKLIGLSGSAVCMTLGGRGCLAACGGEPLHIPGIRVAPPLDICGAGDTFLAAFACSLAAGAEFCEAAFVANLASSVTIKKIGQTGSASCMEILWRYDEAVCPDMLHNGRNY